MQDNRGDHLSRDLPQVLVRAIYGLWKNKTSAYYAWLHMKSCYYMLIMYMKRVWGMTAQLGVLYSDMARSFNQWERALDPNFVIFNHSFRQQIGHLPRPKFIPHNLGRFLLFCYRSSKNRLNYPYRHNFSLYSSFLVCHSPSPINCSLSAFLFSLFSVLFFLFPFSFFLFYRRSYTSLQYYKEDRVQKFPRITCLQLPSLSPSMWIVYEDYSLYKMQSLSTNSALLWLWIRNFSSRVQLDVSRERA